MRSRIAVFVVLANSVLLTPAAARAEEDVRIKAFHSGRCLAPGGKPGVEECAHAVLAIDPVPGTGRVMIRAGGNCLYSNRDGRFAWYACNPAYDDQQWEFTPLDPGADPIARSSLDNFHMLRAVNSGKCLFSNQDGRFGVYACTSSYADQYWKVHSEVHPLQAFHSRLCLSPAGMVECSAGENIDLVPVGPGLVMLKHAATNQCLYSNRDGRFAWYGCNPGFDDQFWRPLPPDGAPAELSDPRGGYRMLQAVNSGKCLFSNKDGRFAVYGCTPAYADQYWHLAHVGGHATMTMAPPPPPIRPVLPVAVPPPPPGNHSTILSTDKTVYRVGEPIVVSWVGMADSSSAWTTIVKATDATDQWGDWAYTGGGTTGSRTVTTRLPPGDYEARAYPDNATNLLDRVAFSVR
jgi:hypothetical protein